MKSNKIEKLIKEDLVNHQSSSGGDGNGWQNRSNSMQMSLVDILKADRGDYEKARKVMPHQLQTVFDRLLSLAEQANHIKDDFIRAYSNPIIKDDETKREQIKSMVKDLNEANQRYQNVVKTLDQLQF